MSKKTENIENMPVENNETTHQQELNTENTGKTEKTIKNKALELITMLGIERIYYTSDGFWFTKKELAETHAKTRKVEITEFKS